VRVPLKKLAVVGVATVVVGVGLWIFEDTRTPNRTDARRLNDAAEEHILTMAPPGADIRVLADRSAAHQISHGLNLTMIDIGASVRTELTTDLAPEVAALFYLRAFVDEGWTIASASCSTDIKHYSVRGAKKRGSYWLGATVEVSGKRTPARVSILVRAPHHDDRPDEMDPSQHEEPRRRTATRACQATLSQATSPDQRET